MATPTPAPGPAAAGLDAFANTPNSIAATPSFLEPTTMAPNPTHQSLPWILGLIWAGGLLFVLSRQLVGQISAHRLRRTSTPAKDSSWLEDLADLKDEMGLKRTVELRVHLALSSPISVGASKPSILLPPDYPTYSADDRRAVLLHELAHLRNRDGLFRWCAAMACMIHWPNPLVWLAKRSMRLAEERVSDDAVLNGGVNSPSYAELLAKLAKAGPPAPGRLASNVTAMAQPSTLLQRISAILRSNQSRSRPRRLTSIAFAGGAFVFAVLAGGLGWVDAQEEEVVEPRSEPAAAAAENPAAAENRNSARKIYSKHQEATVVVTAVSTIHYTTDGAPLPNEERRSQTLGTIVSKNGLIMVANSAIDQAVGKVGSRGRQAGEEEYAEVVAAKSTFKEIQINLADGSEYQATIVHAEAALDLAFLIIDPKQLTDRDKPLPFVNLTNRVAEQEIGIADEIVGLSRSSPVFKYIPTVISGQVTGISDRNVIYYINTASTAQGIPIFSLDGRFVGLTVQRIIDGKRTKVLGALDGNTIAEMAKIASAAARPGVEGGVTR